MSNNALPTQRAARPPQLRNSHSSVPRGYSRYHYSTPQTREVKSGDFTSWEVDSLGLKIQTLHTILTYD